MKFRITGALVLVGIGMFAYPFVLSDKRAALLVSASLAVSLAVVGLAASSRVFSWCAAGTLAVHYGIALSLSDKSVDLAAPAVAVAWLMTLELIDLRHLLSVGGAVEPAVVRHRLRFLLLSSTIGTALAATALLAGAIVDVREPAFVLVAALIGAGVLMGPVFLAGEATKERAAP